MILLKISLFILINIIWIFRIQKFDLDGEYQLTLIQYAAFFGSFKIFQYLLNNKAVINDKVYEEAIRGNNAEIFQLLEENRGKVSEKIYEECLVKSILCHHNNIANYILNTYCQNDSNQIVQNLLFYNFCFFH